MKDKIILELDYNESRALSQLLWNHKSCSSGCVYEEMRDSDKDCDECEFTRALESLSDKLADDDV